MSDLLLFGLCPHQAVGEVIRSQLESRFSNSLRFPMEAIRVGY